MIRRFRWLTIIGIAALFIASCVPFSKESGIETEPDAKVSTVPSEGIPAQASHAEAKPAASSEAVESTEKETEEDLSGTALFFGKRMDEHVASVNVRTLSDPGSMLFDPLSDEPHTAERVISLINAYSIPAGGYYGNVSADDAIRAEILENRNLKPLYDRMNGLSAASPVVYPKCGILVRNASVRSFPTSVRFTSNGRTEEFDLFQESVLPFASGVRILHESADGSYYFCRGEYYHGWIRKEDVAVADNETFRDYLTPEKFAVSFGTDKSVPWNRLGLVLPIRSVTEKEILIAVPERDGKGELRISEKIISKDSKDYQIGFAPFSPDLAARIASGLLDTPYGWGDEHGLYDCSGFTGAIYRMFGYVLPRNSSAASHFGGTKLDLKGMDPLEKKAVLRNHPGAVLSWPGHAMFFQGAVEKDGKECFAVIQEGTGWCDEKGVWKETNRVTVSDLTEMYRTNGESFLDSIETLITAD